VECRDGTTHLIFEPLDFIARLADLEPKTLALFAGWALPKPRVNRTYFQRVFAPNSLYCAQETPHHDRQRLAFTRVHALVSRDYAFADKAAVRDYFTRLTGLFKNFNYAAADSPEYQRLLQDIDALAEDTP
jgi:hypothetical protein